MTSSESEAGFEGEKQTRKNRKKGKGGKGKVYSRKRSPQSDF